MKYLYRFFITCVFLLPGTVFTTAQTENSLPSSKNGEEKTVIIRLKDQFDVNGSIRRKTKNFSPALKRETIARAMKEQYGKSQTEFLASLEKTGLRHRLKTLKNYWITNVIICKATDEVIAQLKENELVESVKIDRLVKVIPEETPVQAPGTSENGESADAQTPNMQTAEKSEPKIAKNISLVRAPEANAYGYTGKGVVVALIDTGTNYEHEDLQGALWTEEGFPNHGWDFQNDDNDPMDDMSHGTHCAGTIVGNGKAGTRTGVAPEAKLMILKAMDNKGNSTEKAFWDAIEFAIEHQANLISASAGWPAAAQPDKKAWRDIMVRLQDLNILFVVAAGNEGQSATSRFPIPDNVRTPANCPAAWLHPGQPNPGKTSSVIAVGAVDEKGTTKIPMSSIGPVTWKDVETYEDYPYNPGDGLIKPDIVAPGNNIMSLNYANKQGYVAMTGTSMATPCVAGIVAVMLSKNPNLTPADIVRIISESSIKINDGFDNYTGGGRADALFATLYTPNTDVNCTDITFEETEGYADGKFNPDDKGNLRFTFENTSAEDFSGYTLELVSYSPRVTVTKNKDAVLTVGAGSSATLEAPYSIYVHPDASPADIADIAVVLKKGDEVRTNLFRIPVYQALVDRLDIIVKETEGNGNGLIDRGEKVELVFPFVSIGNAACVNLKTDLTVTSPYLTLTGKEEKTDDTESGTFHTYTYRFDVASDVPDWQRAGFSMHLKGDNIDTTFTYRLSLGQTAILLVDKSRNGASAEAIREILQETKDLSFDFVKELPASLSNYRSVWYFAGVYPNNSYLKKAEKEILVDYLDKGGCLYMEGGDVWYDKTVPMRENFHIEFIEDNGGTLDVIRGCKEGFNEGDAYPYTYTSKSIDEISPIEPAFALYKNSDPEFVVAVGYKDDKTATIGSSFEIGGISSLEAVVPVDRYLNFFGFGPFTNIPEVSGDSKTIEISYRLEGDRLVINFLSPLPQDTRLSLYSVEGYRLAEGAASEGDTELSLPVTGGKGIYLLHIATKDGVTTRKIGMK